MPRSDLSITPRPELKLNAAQCKHCGYVMISFHRHDFKQHSCKPGAGFMVDGGNEYVRRGWSGGGRPEDDFIERSIYWPSEEPASVVR